MMRKATLVHGLRTLAAMVLAGPTLVMFTVLLVNRLADMRNDWEVSLANQLAAMRRPTDWESFTDVTLPAVERMVAFDRLHVTDDEAKFAKLLRVLVDERDSDVLSSVISRVTAKPPDNFDRDEPLRRAWSSSMRMLMVDSQRSISARLAAFDSLRSVSNAVEILDIVQTQVANAIDAVLAERMLSSIDAMTLDASDVNHEELTRALIAAIAGGANPRFVARCVERFDALSPPQLCDLLLDAYGGADSKEAALQSLGVYARHVDRARVEVIGRYVEHNLRRLVTLDLQGQLSTSFELEYFIQSAGMLQSLSTVRYDVALDSVATLLRERQRLEDPTILDTVVEAFAALANGDGSGRHSLSPLRELLVESDDTPVRATAALALGELNDDLSLPALRSIALNEHGNVFVSLQVAAVEGLTKLGEHARRSGDEKSVSAILSVFQQLIQHLAGAPEIEQRVDVLRAAIAGFGRLAQPDQGNLLFPLLLDPETTLTGIAAIQTIIGNSPEAIQPLVDAFLDWRSQVGDTARVPDDPNRSLVGFGFFTDSLASAKTEVAVKSTVAALARAHRHGSLASRALAGKLLHVLLGDVGAPPLDPTADDDTRTGQIDRWISWWDAASPNFEFTSGRLVPQQGSAAR
jgi:hypothetical protein